MFLTSANLTLLIILYLYPHLMNKHKDIHPICFRSVSLSIDTVKFQKIIYVEGDFVIQVPLPISY